MTDFKGKNYSVSKPSADQYGASMNVYFNNDSYMELSVEMTWCSRQDIVEIAQIDSDYYDDEENVIDTSSMDLESMVIDICEHFNTFGDVENEMAKAYHADNA